MPNVYNSTTVEFQTGRSTGTYTYYANITKYGLPIVGCICMAIGSLLFFCAILIPNDPPSWLPFTFGIVLVFIGIGIIIIWKIYDKKLHGTRGFSVLKPRVKESHETGEPIIIQSQEDEFVNHDGPTDPRVLLHPNVL